MRIALCFIFLISVNLLSAQTTEIKNALVNMESSMIAGDTTELNKLLHPQLSFGHSNGWVQTKGDVINDLSTGKLRYRKMGREAEQWTVTENLAIIRYSGGFTYLLNGTEGNLDLHVVQVWMKTNEGWKLITRQSTKIQPSGN